MKRRTYLKSVIAVASGAFTDGSETARPIELHVDLTVDQAKEQEMLHNFRTIFQPAARKQPGFIDVKMLKLRLVMQGELSQGANYRFVLTFANEELRKQWVASETHQQVWPTIEKTLKTKDYTIVLYDET